MKTSIFFIALILSNFLYGQNNCEEVRYWDNNDSYIRYDSISFKPIEIMMFLGDTNFVFEWTDHIRIQIIFGTYEADSSDNFYIKYDFQKTKDYCLQIDTSKLKCNFTLIPNIKHYRAINWKRQEDKLIFEYIIRPDSKETKEFILTRKK